MDDVEGRLANLATRLAGGAASDLDAVRARAARLATRRRRSRAGVTLACVFACALPIAIVARRPDREPVHVGGPTTTSINGNTSTTTSVTTSIVAAPEKTTVSTVVDVAWGAAPARLTFEPSHESAPVAPPAIAVDDAADVLLVLDAGSGRLVSFHTSDGSFAAAVDLGSRTVSDVVVDPATGEAYVLDPLASELLMVTVTRDSLTLRSHTPVGSSAAESSFAILDGAIVQEQSGRYQLLAVTGRQAGDPPFILPKAGGPSITLDDATVVVAGPSGITLRLSLDAPIVDISGLARPADRTTWVRVHTGPVAHAHARLIHYDDNSTHPTATSVADDYPNVGDTTHPFAAGKSGLYVMQSDAPRFQILRVAAAAGSTLSATPSVEIRDTCGGLPVDHGDIDGDGKPDTVYSRFDGGARVGVCTSSGIVDEIAGAGQGEDFWLVDPQSTGRDLIVFGSNSASGGGDQLATIVDRRLAVVDITLPYGQTDLGEPDNAFAKWGCSDLDGDGHPSLTTITFGAEPGGLVVTADGLAPAQPGAALVWHRTVYAIDGAAATIVSTDHGTYSARALVGPALPYSQFLQPCTYSGEPNSAAMQTAS